MWEQIEQEDVNVIIFPPQCKRVKTHNQKPTKQIRSKKVKYIF